MNFRARSARGPKNSLGGRELVDNAEGRCVLLPVRAYFFLRSNVFALLAVEGSFRAFSSCFISRTASSKCLSTGVGSAARIGESVVLQLGFRHGIIVRDATGVMEDFAIRKLQEIVELGDPISHVYGLSIRCLKLRKLKVGRHDAVERFEFGARLGVDEKTVRKSLRNRAT